MCESLKGADIDTNDTSLIAEAVALAEQSEVVIMVLGDSLASCGEWADRSSLDLAGSQLALLSAITKVCVCVCVCV